MNDCPSVQDRLHDWIDLELDSGDAAEIARHVDGCSACAEIARAIRSLKTLVRQKAERPTLPPRLEARVREAIALESLRAERSRIIQFPLRRLRWAAAFVILVAGAVMVSQLFAPKDLHAEITESALASHLESLGAEDLPRYSCMSTTEVEQSLEQQLGYPVDLPDFPAGVCLKGLSVKQFHGHQVGKVYYEIDDQPFSLFVVPAEMRGGTVLCCCHKGQKLRVYCTSEGDYCLTFVTTIDREIFQTTLLEPALNRKFRIVGPKKPVETEEQKKGG